MAKSKSTPLPHPGPEQCAQAIVELLTLRTVAAFKAGDVCWFFDEGSGDFVCELEIVDGYGVHKVGYPDGSTNFRWGYVARPLGGATGFYPAAWLRDSDGGIRHIRLAA